MEHYLRQGFEKWGKVQVEGADKLIIYKRTGNHLDFPTQTPNDGLKTYTFEDFAGAFDASAGPGLPLTYPSVDPPIAHPLHINFGDQIWLEGYDVASSVATASGRQHPLDPLLARAAADRAEL